MMHLLLFKEWQIEMLAQIPALTVSTGFPGWLTGKESACQCSRQPTPVFLPGKSHGQTEEPGGLQSVGVQRVGHN